MPMPWRDGPAAAAVGRRVKRSLSNDVDRDDARGSE